MTEPERIAYSRHECAALCGAGIWFENMLMQIVLRHLAEMPGHRSRPTATCSSRSPTSAGTRPCSASSSAGPARRLRAAGRHRRPRPLDDLPGGRALGYLLILAVEELLDVINRATMKRRAGPPDRRARSPSSTCSRRRATSASPRPTSPRSGPPSTTTNAPPSPARTGRRRQRRRAHHRPRRLRGARHRRRSRDRSGQPAPPLRASSKASRSSPPSSPRLGVIDDTNRAKWEARGLLAEQPA